MIKLFFTIFSFFLILFFTFLNYFQETKKEQNQTFWQWDSPSGSYRVHYIEKGAGPRHVLLLHGFAAHSYTWRFLIDDLVKAGYHVWSIDFIGFGYSDKPMTFDYGLSSFTNQIEAFMQAKQIQRASIIGHSMGGGLALSLAMTSPHRTQSLVLIDALAFPVELPLYLTLVKRLGNWTKPLMGKTMVRRVLHQIFYDPKKVSEEEVQAYTFPLHTPGGKEAFIKTLQNFHDQEFEAFFSRFQEIKIPILIIWGEKDTRMPLEYFRRLSDSLPRAKALVIPNCGHAPQEECPLEVNKAILQFLHFLYTGT